jgi:hypothetical protein
MAHCAILMRPFSWSQHISHYNRKNVVGWQLRASCRAENADLDPGPGLRLTSGEQIQDVNIYLDFDNREPTNTDSLKPHDFSEVWEQVRQGGYVDCIIEITIRPVEFLGEDTGWEWDVIHNQGIYITDASVRFVRTSARKKVEPTKRRRWFATAR